MAVVLLYVIRMTIVLYLVHTFDVCQWKTCYDLCGDCVHDKALCIFSFTLLFQIISSISIFVSISVNH